MPAYYIFSQGCHFNYVMSSSKLNLDNKNNYKNLEVQMGLVRSMGADLWRQRDDLFEILLPVSLLFHLFPLDKPIARTRMIGTSK